MAMSKAELDVWSLRYSLRVHKQLGLGTDTVKELLAKAEAEVEKYDLLFYDILGKD